MNKAETKNILVYIEVADAAPVKVSLESLAQAKRMADEKGEKVIAAVIGQNIGDGRASCRERV